jgi:gamma-glutamylcyclotransferase (GGCT)/AIG2-like uncharacterized protein YtfP
MKTQLYFAYGMNTNIEGMNKRCPKAVSHGYARLLDYEFRFAGPADVIPSPNRIADGVLWTITEDCLKSLDALEGYPYFYDRKNVRVLHEGRLVTAMVYYMQPGHVDSIPSDGYFNCLMEGYTDHGVPLDQLYQALDFIEEIPVAQN